METCGIGAFCAALAIAVLAAPARADAILYAPRRNGRGTVLWRCKVAGRLVFNGREPQTAYAGGLDAYLYSSGFAGPTPYPPAELECIGSYDDAALPGGEEQPVSSNGANCPLSPNSTYWIVVGGTGSQFADNQWEDSTARWRGRRNQFHERAAQFLRLRHLRGR